MAPGILLDLDRTLVDLQTFTDYAAALADVTALVGTWAEADVPRTDWDSATQGCMAVLNSLVGDPRWAQVSAVVAVHERAAIPRSRPMPTLGAAVRLLHDVPTAVVTLLPTDVATAALVLHGVDVRPGGAVDLVVGRSVTERPKPAPDGLLHACELLGIDPGATTMIGDSSWDEAAAAAAGIAFIGVPSGPQAFTEGRPVAASLEAAVRAAVGR